MAALGEVMTTATRDLPRDFEPAKNPLTHLQDLVDGKRIAVCGPGHSRLEGGFLACVNELHSVDKFLDPTDVLILSAALCCPDCEQFYTNDSVILKSTTLRKAAESRGIKIVNPA